MSGNLQGQRRASIPLELGLRATVHHYMDAEIESRSSGRAARALAQSPGHLSSPQRHLILWYCIADSWEPPWCAKNRTQALCTSIKPSQLLSHLPSPNGTLVTSVPMGIGTAHSTVPILFCHCAFGSLCHIPGSHHIHTQNALSPSSVHKCDDKPQPQWGLYSPLS